MTYGAALYVDPEAAAGGDGSEGAPFSSLTEAATAVRTQIAAGLPEGGLIVWVAGGTYRLSSTWAFTDLDSGDADRPVVWRARPGERVVLTGAVPLDPQGFEPVTEQTPGWERMDSTARSSLVVLDLGAQGVTDYGTLRRRGFCNGSQHSAAELFVNGEPMRLGRWPDADASDLPADPKGTELTLYGTSTPALAGHFTRIDTSDNVGVFKRDELVDGLQYYLYRYYWQYQGSWHRAWFLTTTTSGYPTNTDPWWSLYSKELGPMNPSNGAVGNPSFVDPLALNHGFASITTRIDDTHFAYAGDRPTRWAAAPDGWLHGYWMYAWADCHVPLGGVDTTTQTLTLGDSPGYGVTEGQPWYAYNLLEEVTSPGEWYLDRTLGLLYLYPPAELSGAQIELSMMESPLVSFTAAHDLRFMDITLESGRADLLSLSGGENVTLSGLTVRNGGASGVVINGTGHHLNDSVVHDVGNTAVSLGGGDRTSLTPAGNGVSYSHLYRFGRWEWTYRPGVSLSGVGQQVSHNLIDHAPHSAILYGGNDHVIELNEIHDVNQFSSDAGAIYSGRDWGARGNVIRNNYIHDLSTWFQGYGVHGIYLDDCLSGVTVEGNLLVSITGHGILHGGGRDNHMNNNVIAHSGDGIGADARCFAWRPDAGPNDVPGDSWNLLEKLEKVSYQQEPWLSRFPECAAIPDDWATLIDPANNWLYPEGCTFSRNLGYLNEAWMSESDSAFTWYSERQDNVEATTSPFVDEANADLNLSSDALSSVPGMQAIPFSEIGVRL